MGGKHMSFFISRVRMFPDSKPLRLPMGAGSYVTKDPEVRNATVRTNGGDEVHSGSTPGALQQSVADVGQMTPRERNIDITTYARVIHVIDGETELYRTTHIELEAIASITIDHLRLRVGHVEIVTKDLWQYTAWGDVKELEQVINDLKAAIKAKAENLLTGRERVENVLKENGVNLLVERTVYDGEYYDEEDEEGDC